MNSLTVFGYEDYAVNWIDGAWFCKNHDRSQYNDDRSPLQNWNLYTGFMFADDGSLGNLERLSEYGTRSNYIKTEFLKDRVYTPTFADTLYFTKGCHLARSKFEQYWKRSVKASNAGVVVLPEFQKWDSTCKLMFVNKKERRVWVLSPGWTAHYKEMIQNAAHVGETFIEFLQNLPTPYAVTNFKNFCPDMSVLKTSKLVHNGKFFVMPYSQMSIFEALVGVYQRVIFEDDLTALLPVSDKVEITPQTFENLYYQLDANDRATVVAALKCIASMNYCEPYKNAYTLLLDLTFHNWYGQKNVSTAVAQMCRDLGFRGSSKFIRHNYMNVTPEELEIFSTLYKIPIKQEIETMMEKYQDDTNAKVELDYNIKITL